MSPRVLHFLSIALGLGELQEIHRVLRSFDQVIHINEEVIVKLDEVDGRLGLYLVDDHACSFAAVLFGVLDLFTHQAVHHLARLPLCWDAVVCRRK